MGVRRSRFSRPASIKGSRATAAKQYVVFEPTGGLNKAQPIYDLAPGETPQSQNFVVDNGFLLPRSGFSRWIGGTSFLSSDVGLVAFNAFSNNTEYAYAGSAKTFQLFDGAAWNLLTSKTTISSTTTGYYSAAEIFNANSGIGVPEGPVVVFTNHQNYPFFHSTETVPSALSGIREFHSIASLAEYVTAFDDRLIFFNVSLPASGVTRYPHRVVWSARGDWSNFTNGGGFEDLTDMQGPGTGLVSMVDRMVLTSSEQVWVASPRRDSYAFDFYLLDPTRGCPYPRTLKATEAGAVWLGAGYQMYRLVGNQIQSIGVGVERHLIDTVREPTLLHSSYNPDEHTYNLFYSDTTGEYPSRYLQLYLDQLDRGDQSRTVFLDQTFGSIASVTTVSDNLFDLGYMRRSSSYSSNLLGWSSIFTDYPLGMGNAGNVWGGGTSGDVRLLLLSSASTLGYWDRAQAVGVILDNASLSLPSDASLLASYVSFRQETNTGSGNTNPTVAPAWTLASMAGSSATTFGDLDWFSIDTTTEWLTGSRMTLSGSEESFNFSSAALQHIQNNDYTIVAIIPAELVDDNEPSTNTINWELDLYGHQVTNAALRPVRRIAYYRDLTREISVADRYNGSIYAIGEDGIAYRQLSVQTNDDGVAVDARWRTGAISDDRDLSNNLGITEAWLGTRQSASTATVGLYASYDEAQTFSSVGTFTLSTLTPIISLPISPVASRAPQVELRVNDGSRPEIGRLQLNLRSYSGRRRG